MVIAVKPELAQTGAVTQRARKGATIEALSQAHGRLRSAATPYEAGVLLRCGVARISRKCRPMKANEVADELKSEITKGIGKLAMLRDEAKLHLHLATLDAKQEWDEKLEPRIDELQRSAHDLSDSTIAVVHDLVGKVEGFVSKLRGKDDKDGKPADSAADTPR